MGRRICKLPLGHDLQLLSLYLCAILLSLFHTHTLSWLECRQLRHVAALGSLPYAETTAGRASKSAFATPVSISTSLSAATAPAPVSTSYSYSSYFSSSAHPLDFAPLPLAVALCLHCPWWSTANALSDLCPCLSSIIVACFGLLLLLLCCRFWPHVARFTASSPFVVLVLLFLLLVVVATQISLSVCTPAEVASFVVCFCFQYQQQQQQQHQQAN